MNNHSDENHCKDHGKNSNTLCNHSKTIVEMKDTHQRDRDEMGQRIFASEEGNTKTHATLFDRIQAVDDKSLRKSTFFLLITVFAGLLIAAVAGPSWWLSKNMDAMGERHTVSMKEVSEENKEMANKSQVVLESTNRKLDQLVTNLNTLTINSVVIKADLGHLKEDFKDFKGDTEDKLDDMEKEMRGRPSYGVPTD